MINFRRLSKTVTIETFLSEEELFLGIEKYPFINDFFEGRLYSHSFLMMYSPNFLWPIKDIMPSIEVIGQTSTNQTCTKVEIEMKLNATAIYMILAGCGMIFLFYFLEKFSIVNSSGISDTIFPLLVVPIVLSISFLIELHKLRNCEEFFTNMIRNIERKNKNEL